MVANRSIKLSVNPKIVRWSIDSSGWKDVDLISKLKVAKKTYDGWLSGKEKITINKLEELSKRTKRPIALFFLEDIPEEKPLPKDYRLNPEKRGEFNRKTVLAIRNIRRLQEVIRELSPSKLNNEKFGIGKIELKDSPVEVGKKIRDKFSLTEETQRKFKDPYKLYNYLRERLESEDVYSFQISMPLEDARGFALSDQIPEIAVVNSKDLITSRIFTLIHELGHILLGDTGISVPEFENNDKVEKWCNDFASSVLLPKQLAIKIFNDNNGKITETQTLNSISRRYKISKSMFLYNMVKFKHITPSEYHAVLDRYKKEYLKLSKKNSGGSGVPTEKKRLSELGNKFISLVADGMENKKITYSDALEYLSIKSRNFDKLINKVS